MPVCNHLPKSLRDFCTDKFLRDHLACPECAKAKCNKNFQHRRPRWDIPAATILIYTPAEWLRIKQEIIGRQNEYAKAAAGTKFETHTANACYYYQRSAKSAQKKGPARFSYSVAGEGAEGTRSPSPATGKPLRYRLHHFGGIL